MKKLKILYIQHAGSMGGSCMSLLYTIQGLDKSKYEPVVALIQPSGAIVELYEGANIKTIPWQGIVTFQHTTAYSPKLQNPFDWLYAFRFIADIKQTIVNTQKLIEVISPDIVHLNSAVLALSAKVIATHCKIPFVWHVREHPVSGYFGLRYKWLRKGMLEWPSELIFISEADQNAWVNAERGVVIHNFINFSQFDCSIDGQMVRHKYNIETDSPVILYLGGNGVIKGIFPLLNALAQLKKQFPTLRCLMPGCQYQPSGHLTSRIARSVLPILGTGTLSQRIEKSIKEFGLEEVCIQLPFQTNIAPFFAASNVLVFPAIQPHFARPVIEAGAMKKPVVASRLNGISELVEDGKTGFLVNVGDSKVLVERIGNLLENPVLAHQMGQAGYLQAQQKFSSTRQIAQMMKIYERIR